MTAEPRMERKSCLPEKLSTFIGRETVVKEIYSLLLKNGGGIVSVVGGPGFGKSTIAVEVSHRIKEEKNIPVIFSYLSNTSNVDEATLRLCLDVGVRPEADPKSSLIFWARNMEKKVVLVMDDIDKLLEGETRSQFNDLISMLRKNSDQQLMILTTSRAGFSIPNLSIAKVSVNEMDPDSSMELLRKNCPNVELEDDYLMKLAELCGLVPLALCIAASRIQDTDDPSDLLNWLEEQPMKVLQSPEQDQHVSKAIGMSFERLSDENQKSFVRLSVLNGSFDRYAAEKIIKRDKMGTQDFLKNLVNRSLMQRGGERFTIYPLVRSFLTEQRPLENERVTARELMVEHYLELSQSLTLKCYSKDGFTDASESLKKDAHNIEETLKVCCDRKSESLVIKSDIYQSSSRYFYNTVRNFTPEAVMQNFLEFCAGLAKRQNHIAIQINFQCLLADRVSHKSGWRSVEYADKMKKIKEDFDDNEEVLKEDMSLLSHYYYSYGRYISNEDPNSLCPDPFEEADDYVQKSLNLRQAESTLGKVDQAITLIQLGRTSKRRAHNEFRNNRSESERFMTRCESYYKQALVLANEVLGDHEITFTCHKVLGDLYMNWRKNETALDHYNNAETIQQKLGLEPNESLVYLLKNHGLCCSYLRRFEQAVELLEKARDIAEKLVESKYCLAHVYLNFAQVLNSWKPECRHQEAKEYAAKGLEMKEILSYKTVSTLNRIMNDNQNRDRNREVYLSWRQ